MQNGLARHMLHCATRFFEDLNTFFAQVEDFGVLLHKFGFCDVSFANLDSNVWRLK